MKVKEVRRQKTKKKEDVMSEEKETMYESPKTLKCIY